MDLERIFIIGPEELRREDNPYGYKSRMSSVVSRSIYRDIIRRCDFAVVVDYRFFKDGEFAIYVDVVKCRYDDSVKVQIKNLGEYLHYLIVLQTVYYGERFKRDNIYRIINDEIKDFFREEISKIAFEIEMKKQQHQEWLISSLGYGLTSY